MASVSHELRTPLSAVLGFAEELRSNAGSFRADLYYRLAVARQEGGG